LQPIMGTTINHFIAGKESEYDFGKAKELAESLRDISITDALSLQAFFFKRSLVLKKDFVGSEIQSMKKQKSKQGLKSWAKGGGSTLRIKLWLGKSLFSWKR
jgi:hypothetical protein